MSSEIESMNTTYLRLNDALCQTLVSQLGDMESQSQRDIILLPPHRDRRDDIIFAENIANALFGMLDAEYAKRMSNTIDMIKGNE